MTKEELLVDESVYLGTCRNCGHDLVISEDQDSGPVEEISLECSVLDTQDCVAGEWFKISEFF